MGQYSYSSGSQLIILFTIFVIFICLSRQQTKIPKLILISMDGMRYNYLDNLPADKIANFKYFMKNGVKAKFIRNVFPSSTFPNHMSIASGLYPESHGIVGNNFWDPYLQDVFRLGNYRQNFESKWFDVGAEPIWVTNHGAGSPRDSGVVMWPGGVAEIKNFMPRVIPALYWNNVTFNWTLRVDNMIDWFQNDKTNVRPINLGILYFEEPDEVAHRYGPDTGKTVTKEVQEKIFELDDILGYLKKKLIETNLIDEMNIILTSDHGQTDVGNNKMVNLDEFVSRSLYTTRGIGLDSLVTNMDPAKGTSSDDLYKELKEIPNIYLYRKGDKNLTKFHLSKNRRFMEFLLEAKDGFIMGNNDTLRTFGLVGSHGYDPNKVPKMHPFFIASGPAFKKGFVSEAFDIVDIYPLMCYVLGIKPAPNNGTLENVRQLLTDPPPPSKEFSSQLTVITLLVVLIFIALVGGVYSIAAFNQNKMQRRKYSQINRNIINHSRQEPSSLLEGSDEDDEI